MSWIAASRMLASRLTPEPCEKLEPGSAQAAHPQPAGGADATATRLSKWLGGIPRL